MKTKLLILGALLISATAFGQSKGKGKSQTHPLPPAQQQKTNHGAVVSDVTQQTSDGKTVSAVASSKNKGNHNGDDKMKQPKMKKSKKIKKNTPAQKKIRTKHHDVGAASKK